MWDRYRATRYAFFCLLSVVGTCIKIVIQIHVKNISVAVEALLFTSRNKILNKILNVCYSCGIIVYVIPVMFKLISVKYAVHCHLV